jgi:MFS family permease
MQPPPAEPPGADRSEQAAVAGARGALLLLLAINLFNYIDRQVLAAVEPEIRRCLLAPGDPNGQAKMGLLSTAFLVSYMVAAPLFGWLAGRYRRWALIAAGVVLWSFASGASGLALTFAALLVTRCFVGIGEGAYGPVAPTLLSDYYPVARRGRVLAWFYVAIPVGSALGYALGGQFAQFAPERQSWRWAFYAVVIPGVLLGVWALLLREPARGAADGLAAPPRRARLADYRLLLRIPSYALDTLGMAAMTFAMGAMGWWMPAYLERHAATPLWGVEPRTTFGALTAVAGLLATILGGLAGDALRGRWRGSYFLVSGLAMLAGVPSALAFLHMEFPAAWFFVFLTVFLLFFSTGPTNTILANVTHPSLRATGFAMNILAIHVLGDAISPPIVGAIADRWSLDHGFLAVTAFIGAGGILWIWGARHLDRDTAAAPRLLD